MNNETVTPRQLQALYQNGENISSFLRERAGAHANTREMIEISYDLQTGNYVEAMKDPEFANRKDQYTTELAKAILSCCRPKTILEAGIGEATTLSGVLSKLPCEVESFGFDLSWSRVAQAKVWLAGQGMDEVTLCSGDLFHIPFADNSIDVVYTSHAIEPNGGNEKPILKELFRVAKRHLILCEPGYEFASTEGKQRMEFHGYCRDLRGIATSIGCDVNRHELLAIEPDLLNPTTLTVIEKTPGKASPDHLLACPKFKTPLKDVGGMLFSPEALTVYPCLAGIPCLRVENGIFASHFERFIE